jgi:hypothetical protein
LLHCDSAAGAMLTLIVMVSKQVTTFQAQHCCVWHSVSLEWV